MRITDLINAGHDKHVSKHTEQFHTFHASLHIELTWSIAGRIRKYMYRIKKGGGTSGLLDSAHLRGGIKKF